RRHTRSYGDWSSDVCSSDLESFEVPALLGLPVGLQVFTSAIYQAVHRYPSQIGLAAAYAVTLLAITSVGVYLQSRLSSSGSKYRSEERRVGKEWRSRRASDQ